MGAQKNCLNETVLLSTHNISSSEYPQHMFWLRNEKYYFFWYALLTKVLHDGLCSVIDIPQGLKNLKSTEREIKNDNAEK